MSFTMRSQSMKDLFGHTLLLIVIIHIDTELSLTGKLIIHNVPNGAMDVFNTPHTILWVSSDAVHASLVGLVKKGQ